ncbi:MAG: hypothetical protein ACKPHO_21395 [Dolichospermum sp.]
MPTEFSPTLLDNDPLFEYEPNKLIDVDSPKWFDWLESNHSFRFTAGNGGENSYRARKELNKSQEVYYWYAVKKVNNKLHKKYIGKTNEVTHRRLIEVAEVIRQPSGKQPKEQDIQPENTSQVTPQFEDRLNKLEALVQQHLKQIQEGVAIKKHDSSVGMMGELEQENKPLPNELDKLTNQVTELTNELDSKNSKLSELTNELDSKNSKLQELTNTIVNLNSKLSELTNELTNKDSQLQDLKSIPLVPVPSPTINEQLTTDNVTTTPGETDDGQFTEDVKSDRPNADPSPQTDKQRKIIDFFADVNIYSPVTADVIKSSGIGEKIKKNKEELKQILGEEIDTKSNVVVRVRSILKKAGFDVGGNRDQGYFVKG